MLEEAFATCPGPSFPDVLREWRILVVVEVLGMENLKFVALRAVDQAVVAERRERDLVVIVESEEGETW